MDDIRAEQKRDAEPGTVYGRFLIVADFLSVRDAEQAANLAGHHFAFDAGVDGRAGQHLIARGQQVELAYFLVQRHARQQIVHLAMAAVRLSLDLRRKHHGFLGGKSKQESTAASLGRMSHDM